MSSQASLNDKASSGRYYMNKIFGRGVERARALDRSSGAGKALGAVRRVTIEPQSDGSHRVVVERVSGAGLQPVSHAGKISAPHAASEHSFAGTGDALRFLSDVLSDRTPAATAPNGEAGHFLDEILDENDASDN
jgi:hypothetical protein